MHIASPKCKKAILSCIYFFKRYEIITLAQPHYQTKTSLVHLAIDHDSDDANKMVALKFLRHRDHFLREVEVRSAGEFNDEFVINTLRIHDSDVDPIFREETISKGIVMFPYCLVMPGTSLTHTLSTLIETLYCTLSHALMHPISSSSSPSPSSLIVSCPVMPCHTSG